MKGWKFIVGLICLYGLIVLVVSQRSIEKKIPEKSKISAKVPIGTEPGAMFLCPRCGFSKSKEGKCPVHDFLLIKEGALYCETCERTSNTTSTFCGRCGGKVFPMSKEAIEGERIGK